MGSWVMRHPPAVAEDETPPPCAGDPGAAGTPAGAISARTPPRWPVLVGAWLAPLGGLLLWLLPLPLDPTAQRLLAIVWVVLVAWMTELLPLPVSSLLIAPALVMAGVAPAKKAFAAYADPILFLFVGSLFAARAMERHGLDRRFGAALTSLPQLSRHPARLRGAFVLGAMLMSMWVSNTATTAVLLPVLLGLVGRGGKGSFAAGSVLALAHASTTGGLATLVGTPPNAITARILAGAGYKLGFLDWMKIGVPISVAMTALMLWVVQRQLPADDGSTLAEAPGGARVPWSRAERITAASFGLMVGGWLLPDLAQAAGAGWAPALAERLEPGAVALCAASILFMLPAGVGQGRVLSWRDAVQIEWGLIFLFGGGIALGEAMFSTGLAKVLGDGLIGLTGVRGLWSLTATSIALGVVLTEFCSNVAAANMLVPLVIGAAEQLGVSPIPPALGAGLGASCGFMLPVAAGSNALVYGTGQISARAMVRVGARIDALACVMIFVLLYLLSPLLGWTRS
jgi:solute carrier family 13 (sodium-dependent dicarboxylate transporter), member 2/3/5